MEAASQISRRRNRLDTVPPRFATSAWSRQARYCTVLPVFKRTAYRTDKRFQERPDVRAKVRLLSAALGMLVREETQ
jgi:hypothetical protein